MTVGPAASPASPRVEIYDASAVRSRLDAILADQTIPMNELPSRLNKATFETPHQLVRSSGDKPTGDNTVDRAYDNATRVDAFMRDTLKRDGWDGKGSTLRASVHFPSDNASWEYERDAYWVGELGQAASLGLALDVTAHEVVHGIYKSEVYDSAAQALAHQPDAWQRAVDESFADVIAAAVDTSNWTMGEDVGDPAVMRDLEHPKLAHMRDVDTSRVIKTTGPSTDHLRPGATTNIIGEHDLSGIASLAAVRATKLLTREGVAKTWYKAMVDDLRPTDRFPEAARATIRAAQATYGATSKESAAVRDAWLSVGVTPAT